MRQSSVLLPHSTLRIADLSFPCSATHVQRTRLAYIHLDNLLHFAKIDRDGRIDGFIAAYLPDEVALLFLRGGEIVTATAFTEQGRKVVPIARALEVMRKEMERGELCYCEAPMEQLAWMYGACVTTPAPRPVNPREPGLLFQSIQHERFTGIVEFISNGRVSFFQFEDGQYRNGYFCGKTDDMPVGRFVETQFAADPDGTPPRLAAASFHAGDMVPEQAPPALIERYRELFWRLADAAEAEVADEARPRATRLGTELIDSHAALRAITVPRGEALPLLVASPYELTDALGAWVKALLEQLEVIAPGVAPAVLEAGTREDRFVLQKAGFYEQLPWTVTW